MKIKFIFSFCFISAFCFGQIPVGYYNGANGLTGAPLMSALHNIIKNHTVVSYANLYVAFDSTDIKPNGEVWDMYSDMPGGTPPYVYTNIAADRCGSYNSEADCFNREHSWPQSWFNGASPAYSDLFHLYPTDGYVNNRRNNYPYGEVSTPIWTSLNGSKLGPNTTTGYFLTVFEPIDEYKGDLARGFFYMSTRYTTEDATWGTSDATNKSVIEPWELCILLTWHHQDTVSTKEIDRNNEVYDIQNNRNPFIDYPEWADSIFVCTLPAVNIKENAEIKFSIFPNPTNENVTIILSSVIDNGVVRLYNYLGEEIITQEIENANELKLNVDHLAKGIYIVQINFGKFSAQRKLVVK